MNQSEAKRSGAQPGAARGAWSSIAWALRSPSDSEDLMTMFRDAMRGAAAGAFRGLLFGIALLLAIGAFLLVVFAHD